MERIGRTDRPQDASVVVATFTDFNYPFCQKLAPVLDSLRSDFPGGVAIDHYHFPLRRHDYAIPSAQAAECAHRQGRFWAMYLSLFSQMDSIGTRAWRDFATDAEVPDTEAFDACMALPPDSLPRIAAGRELGLRIGVTGTPTVWMNGERFEGRTVDAFRERVRALGG